MPTICSRPRNVSAHWLSSVLQHAGFDAEVESFRQTNVGTGQVGQNVRFNLSYGRGQGPQSIVGKFVSDDPASRQAGIDNNTYIKEVRFYQLLKPTVDIRTPLVYFTDIEPSSHDFCLIMEDLYPAQQGDQIEGCDVSTASLALKQLARLHGPRWADESLLQIDWLLPSSPDPLAAAKAVWNACWPGFINRYAKNLSSTQINMASRYGEHLLNLEQLIPGALTITHGDYRLDNMLFNGVAPLTVVDWQTPSLGPGAADVAYFMGTSLPSSLRSGYENKLVEDYYAALCDYKIQNYSFDRCWEDYRRFSFNGLHMAVIASMIVGRTSRGDEMFLAMARRSTQMALELDAGEFLC